MSQVFKVEIVEGGSGVVAEGDPAYPLCRRLQQAGYTAIVLPLVVFMSGNLKNRRHMLTQSSKSNVKHWPLQKRILASAAAEDQLSLVEGDAETSCVHHWILDEKVADPTPGICKICGETRDFPRYPEINTSKMGWNREFSKVHNEWADRLREAEYLAGLRKAA
jgi:hypothetical protein